MRKTKPKREVIETRFGTIIATDVDVQPKKSRSVIQRPLSAEHFNREVKAITKHFNDGILTAEEHKRKYDALLKRYKSGQ